MTLDIKTEVTYLGLREDPPASLGDKPWKHHAYNVLLTFEGRTFDFTYRQGTAHHREPEDAWRDRRSFGVPDYIKHEPRSMNQSTGLSQYPYAIRKRFHEERDAEIIRGALGSIASDIDLFDEYSDDELALDFALIPSKIAEARAHVARAKQFLGHHLTEFLNTYRED